MVRNNFWQSSKMLLLINSIAICFSGCAPTLVRFEPLCKNIEIDCHSQLCEIESLGDYIAYYKYQDKKYESYFIVSTGFMKFARLIFTNPDIIYFGDYVLTKSHIKFHPRYVYSKDVHKKIHDNSLCFEFKHNSDTTLKYEFVNNDSTVNEIKYEKICFK